MMRFAWTRDRIACVASRLGVTRVCRVPSRRPLASVLILVVLLGLTPLSHLAPAHAAALPSGYSVFEGTRLVINNRQVFPDVPFLVYSGRMLVPIRIVAEQLGARVGWDGVRQIASVDTGERHIEMVVGSARALVDSTEVRLDAPAVLYGGRTLVPLRFVAEALGCEVSWDDASRTASVDSAAGVGRQLLAVELELLPEYAILHVRTDGPAPYAVAALANPARLVIDVMDVTPALDWSEQAVDMAAIERIRIGYNSTPGVYTRVVCDLADSVRFDYAPAPDGAGVDVRLFYKVTGIAWADGGLTISSTGPLAAKSFVLTGPDRYVIDLPGATLVPGTQGIDVNSGDVIKVRIAQNQLDPDIVRVVLDLSRSAKFTIASTAHGLRVLPDGVTDPGGAKDPTQPVDPPAGASQAISCEQMASGSRLTVALAAEANADVVVASDGRQVQLQITGAAAGDLAGKPVNDGLIKEYTVKAMTNGDGFSVAIEVSAYAGHTLIVDGRTVVLELARSAIVGRKIAIDPGHGGRDPGCISISGVYEKHVNWPIAVALEAVLKRAGALVKLTKPSIDLGYGGQTLIDGYMRAAVANEWGADLFVSIHCNAFTSSASSGTEVYHYGDSAQSKRLAQLMLNSLVKLGMPNRGVRIGNFVVCRETNMPAVLVELGFLTNPSDERILLDPGKQVKAAEWMAEAIQAYYR